MSFRQQQQQKLIWLRFYYIQDRAFSLFKIIFLRHSWVLKECTFWLLQRNALNLEKTFLHVQTPPLNADCSDSWALSHVWNAGENITFLFSTPLFYFCAHVAFFPCWQCWEFRAHFQWPCTYIHLSIVKERAVSVFSNTDNNMSFVS